jgi:hypothetical protein
MTGQVTSWNDWPSDVLERLTDACDLPNDVCGRLNDVAITTTVAVCERELAMGGRGIRVLPGEVGVCGNRIAGIKDVRPAITEKVITGDLVAGSSAPAPRGRGTRRGGLLWAAAEARPRPEGLEILSGTRHRLTWRASRQAATRRAGQSRNEMSNVHA